MNRLNRRRFMALSSAGVASAVLVACGNEPPSEDELNPTQIPDVAGAPPTLAPMTGTPESSGGGGGDEGGGGGEDGTVEIEAFDLGYSPTELELAPGDTLVMNNTGALEHDLVIEDFGDEEVIPLIAGGESAEWTVPDDVEVGATVTFYCSVAGHREAGMEGTITFVEAGAAGGGEEEAAAGGGGADSVEIEGFEMAFEPAEFEIAPGGTITMNNTGVLEHDFAVDDWGGVLIGPMAGGESGEYTVPEDVSPGDSFTFYCSIPGHRESGMEGTLTIVEAGGGGGGGAAEEAPEEEATPEEEASPAGGATDEQAGGEGGADSVEVEGFEMGFEPSEFTIAPGGTITMNNTGVLEHDFAVDDWGGVLIGPMAGGESGEYTVPEDVSPGETFEFYCSIPGHKESGMVGTLTIGEGGGGNAAAASTTEEQSEQEAATPGNNGAAASGEDGEGVSEVSVSAFEFGYDPAEIEVSPGARVVMVNDGVLEHDIYVDAWGEIAPMAGGGSESEGVIPEDAQPGESFEFYCTVAGHKESGMVGTFTVVEGGGEAASGDDGQSTGEASPEAEISGNAIEIAANEWTYSPAEVEVAPGDTIILRNDGAMVHDMSSEEWGEPFIPDVAHGETGTFVVPDDAEIGATIEIYSLNQGARNLGMTGTITIVEESTAVTAPAAPAATPVVSPAEAATPDAATPEASGDGETIEVEAGDIYFEPSEFEASPGDTIVMTNAGVLEHDMASEALGVTMIEMLSAGETGEFVISEDASGEIDIYCTVAGHKEAGMAGTITIV